MTFGIASLVGKVNNNVIKNPRVRNFVNKIIQKSKNLRYVAVRQISLATGQVTLRMRITKAADYLSQKFKPQISDLIQKKINDKFAENELFYFLSKLLTLDILNKSNKYDSKIKGMVMEFFQIGNSNYNLSMCLNSVAEQLIKGIFSDQSSQNTLSVGFRFLAVLNNSHKISNIVDKINDYLLKKLSQDDKSTLNFTHILCKYCKVDLDTAEKIFQILKEKRIILIAQNEEHGDYFKGCEYLNPMTFKKELQNENISCGNSIFSKHFLSKDIHPLCEIDETDFPVVSSDKKKEIITFLKDLNKNINAVTFESLNITVKIISDAITEEIVKSVESHLMSPCSSIGTGNVTRSLALNQDLLTIESEFEKLNYNPAADRDRIKQLTDELRLKNDISYADIISFEAKGFDFALESIAELKIAEFKRPIDALFFVRYASPQEFNKIFFDL